MRIFVDENIPSITAATLRKAGHDVLDIRGTADKGSTDDVVWQLAQAQGRLLITTDKGFVLRRDDPHFGILVVRLRRPNGDEIHRRVMLAIAQFPAASWPGLVVVMRDVVQSILRAGGSS